MSNIRVITDTDSSLPADLAARHGIYLVPITIQFGEETFETGVNIDDRLLFEKIDANGKLPTTAAPSPTAFVEAYTRAFSEGADSIICIVVGSKISRTYDSAMTALDEFTGKKITVIDSESLSLCQGFMALAAAEAVERGLTHEEAVTIALSYKGRARLFGVLPTLKYLAMGGRATQVQASMAALLNIRPILTIKEGKLDLLEKVRTQRAAMDRLVVLFENAVAGKNVYQAGFVHVNCPEGAALLEKMICAKVPLPPSNLVAEFTAGLSVHGGPGLVAGILVTEE